MRNFVLKTTDVDYNNISQRLLTHSVHSMCGDSTTEEVHEGADYVEHWVCAYRCL